MRGSDVYHCFLFKIMDILDDGDNHMGQIEIDIIIPTYKPGKELIYLLEKLMQQTVKPSRIILMNTEEKYISNLTYGNNFEEKFPNVIIKNISKREFNHGRTRNAGAKRSKAQIMVFMTQDAMPADEHLLEELIKPMVDKEVAVTYARQLPAEDASPIEQFSRAFNYPEDSRVKSEADIAELGIKTYFCSNVCAAYKRYIFDELGGFIDFTIFNEDMLYAAKVIKNGRKIAYAAKARVIHSHNYSGKQQFKRNFDLGVSQADHPEVFESIKSESEGVRMVKQNIRYLQEKGKLYLVPKLVYLSACKLLGYKLGRNYKRLSKKTILGCTMSPDYFRRYWDKNEIPENVYAGYGKNSEGL